MQSSKRFLAVILFSIMIVFSSCSNDDNTEAEFINHIQLEQVPSSKPEKETASDLKNKSDDEDVKYWNRVKALCESAQIVEMDDSVTVGDWTYHINSVEITKKRGNWKNPDWNQFKYDADGNLINEYSFVKANVTI